MAHLDVGCCSKYVQCSDRGICLNRELKESCMYWARNLSKGNVFYGIKPGLRSGCIYLVVETRAYKVLKSSNGYSYAMSHEEVKTLLIGLNEAHLEYSYVDTGYDCIITGTDAEPAHCRVTFQIGQNEYAVKNFNGYEITAQEAADIKNHLDPHFKAQVIKGMVNTTFSKRSRTAAPEQEYSGRETMISFGDGVKLEVPELPLEKKFKEEPVRSRNGWEQISMFDLI